MQQIKLYFDIDKRDQTAKEKQAKSSYKHLWDRSHPDGLTNRLRGSWECNLALIWPSDSQLVIWEINKLWVQNHIVAIIDMLCDIPSSSSTMNKTMQRQPKLHYTCYIRYLAQLCVCRCVYVYVACVKAFC